MGFSLIIEMCKFCHGSRIQFSRLLILSIVQHDKLLLMDDSILLRYNRQIMLPAVGIEGQQKIMDARVLIIGLGGLGSPVSMYLAASGVGHLRLNDFDDVDLSNLQRQIVHTTNAIDSPKVDSAIQTIRSLNPEIECTGASGRLQGEELVTEVQNADVVVDATDNFDIRFALNEACVKTGTPLVSGAAIRFEGQVTVFRPDTNSGPCFRCLFSPEDEPDERCSETGILGSVAGVIGCVQATEVLKIITGVGETLIGRLLLFDAIRMEWQEIIASRDKNCPVCGNRKQNSRDAG